MNIINTHPPVLRKDIEDIIKKGGKPEDITKAIMEKLHDYGFARKPPWQTPTT
jgi:hypothetical protein